MTAEAAAAPLGDERCKRRTRREQERAKIRDKVDSSFSNIVKRSTSSKDDELCQITTTLKEIKSGNIEREWNAGKDVDVEHKKHSLSDDKKREFLTRLIRAEPGEGGKRGKVNRGTSDNEIIYKYTYVRGKLLQ